MTEERALVIAQQEHDNSVMSGQYHLSVLLCVMATDLRLGINDPEPSPRWWDGIPRSLDPWIWEGWVRRQGIGATR